MDPSRNPALQNAKLQTILSNFQSAQRQGSSQETELDMPPPPAYHSVIESESLPEMMHRLYDADEEDAKDTETPEININASTQIRGHGNIISIAQMDSMRIANLLAILIHGGIPPQGQPEGSHTNAPSPASVPAQGKRELPRINININCGATVVGDRNIVGPGLGDIARHMQLAQQRQQQAQQQQRQAQAHLDPNTAQPQQPVASFPSSGQASLATPPMSRSSSFGSEGTGAGAKRKAGEAHPGTPVKRERRA